MRFFVTLLSNKLLRRFRIKVNKRMLNNVSKRELDAQLALTFNQMAGLIDTIKNSLNDSERYSASQLKSIKEIDSVGTLLSSTLISLINVFKDKEHVSESDARLANETIAQCKEFISSLSPHVLLD